MEVNLIEYIEAMAVVRKYENGLKAPENGGVCRCKNCHLKFVYENDSFTREEHNAGSYRYYGVCPYCDKETLITTY